MRSINQTGSLLAGTVGTARVLHFRCGYIDGEQKHVLGARERGGDTCKFADGYCGHGTGCVFAVVVDGEQKHAPS